MSSIATKKNEYRNNAFNNKQSIEEVITELSEDVIRKLLTDCAKNDKKLQNIIRLYHSGAVTQDQKKEWARELGSIEKRYHSYGGYIDYRRAEDYVAAVMSFLERTVEPLLDTGLWSEALDLICLTIEVASKIESDEDEIELFDLSQDCLYYTIKILRNFDIDQKRAAYQRFLFYCGGGLDANTNDFWQDCLFDLFSEEEFVQKNLRLTDEAIAKEGKTADNYWLSYLIEKRIELMKKLDQPYQQISDYRSQFDFIPAVRKMKIRDALECGDVSGAIEYLKKERSLAADDRLSRREYTEKLMQLYEEQGMRDEYKAELISFVADYPPKDTFYLKKLKQYLTDEEWSEYLEDFLCREQDASLRRSVMAEEKMYRRLLDEFETDPFLFGIEKYEKVLRTVYPEEMRDVMFSYLKNRMRYASDRSAYARLATQLKKMDCYPNGAEMAQNIAEEWKTRYRQRKALLEELANAGF